MNRLLNFRRIQAITQGIWLKEPADLEKEIRGGAFDTRHLNDAQIFFAWEGENSDGHRYLQQLKSSSIELIFVEKAVDAVGDKAILKVESSLKALHSLAKDLIAGFQGRIVNITGSSGKTTTKEWLRAVINGHRVLLTNEGSFNNHIGCPITILNLHRSHDLLVLEMGTSGMGEIDMLTDIAPGDISVLLNVGHAHIGMFGSREKIYQAKLELFNHTAEDAVIIVPAADTRLSGFQTEHKKLLFGADAPDFSWSRIDIDTRTKSQTLQFKSPWGEKQVTVPRLGEYVGDLLSAILAVCYALDLCWEQIEPGLEELPQEKGRSTFIDGKDGVLILDDTYNANPESVIAMLKTISSLDKARVVGVVGNLAELDEQMEQSAAVLLDNIPIRLTHLFLSGETGHLLFPMIRDRYPHLDCRLIDAITDMIQVLFDMADHDTVIGIKGSRTAHMERLVYALGGRMPRCHLTRCTKLMMCKHCEEL